MNAVSEVTEPGGQRRRVVFLDSGGVGNDTGDAGHRRPASADRVVKGHVDLGRVDAKIEGFAGEEVRVEDEVDAAVFLSILVSTCILYVLGELWVWMEGGERSTIPASDMHRDVRYSVLGICVVSIPNLVFEMKVVRSSIFCGRGGS